MASQPSDDSESEDEEETATMLGFAVEPSGSLLRNQFRSQLGGLPPWLDPVQLPLTSELTCRASGMSLRFVMQLYAATGTDDPLNFHRSIYLFISPQGTLLSRPGAVRAFRCQLPRVNPYYAFEPPEEGAQPRPLTARQERVATRRNPRWASRTRAQVLGLCGANSSATADAALAEVGREAHRQAYPELELEVEPEPEDDAEDDPAVARLLAEYREQETSQAPQPKLMVAMAAAEAAAAAVGEIPAAAEPAAAATGATEMDSAPVSAADAPPSSAALAATRALGPGSVGGEAEGKQGGEAGGEACLKSEAGPKGGGADEAAETAEEVAALVDAMPGPSADQQDFAYFTTRMARAPEQCIRYCFDEGAQPLWPSSQGRAPRNIPPCERCGAARRFEYQLLPQALHFMQVDSSQPEAPDWATIAVYCCSASCAPRAAVATAAGLREPSGESEAELLAAAGTRVRFHGLQGRADLNGTTGHVLQWDVKGGRWAVECDATEESVRVRTANLTALGEGGEDSEDGEGGAARGGSTPLLGGYAEEFVWVQVDDSQPGA